MAPYLFIAAAALVGFVIRGPVGLLIGAVVGYVLAIALGRVFTLADGGILPRKVRREICERFIRTNGDVVAAAMPGVAPAAMQRMVEGTVEGIFRRSAAVNRNSGLEAALVRQSMLAAGSDLLTEERRPEWKVLLAALIAHLEQDLYARPGDEERDAKFMELDRPGGDEADELMSKFEKCTWLNSRGAAMGKLGRLEDAMRDFQEAIAIYPDHVASYTGLAVCYRELGRLPEALEVLEQAPRRMALPPSKESFSADFDIYPVMATVYMLMGDRERTVECAKKAILGADDPARREVLGSGESDGLGAGPSPEDAEIVGLMRQMISDFGG